MSEKGQFSAEEAEKLGYNPEIVEYFKKVAPGLLEFMWGNGSAHYEAILKNEMGNEELNEKYQRQLSVKPFGNVFESTKHLRAFRIARGELKD